METLYESVLPAKEIGRMMGTEKGNTLSLLKEIYELITLLALLSDFAE